MEIEGAEILKHNLELKNISKEYKAVLSQSKLLDQLYNCGLKTNKAKNKTADVIQVTFTYGYSSPDDRKNKIEIEKLKDSIRKNIDNKKRLLSERKLQDNNKAKKPYTEQSNDIDKKNAVLKEEINKLKSSIEKPINKDTVREELYTNGFNLCDLKYNKSTKKYEKDTNKESVHYVYFFRTTSKSRVGDVLFINEKLLSKIDGWQNMNIELPDSNAKVVENEAYKGLTASSIIGYVNVQSQEILVVKDLDSYITKLCSKVYIENGQCTVSKEHMKIKNTLWDGLALVDDELYDDYPEAGMMVLRHHYFKACGFRTYIKKFMQDYFKENYDIAYATDKFGNKVKVSNIKIITTENALKFLKLGKTFDEWKEIVNKDNHFGICKIDHPSKIGQLQQMSYQMVNSLLLDKENDVADLCKPTIDYINSLKSDINMFLEFLDRRKSSINSNSMFIDLINHNPKYANSDLFRTYRSKTISDYKEELKSGKLLQNADNLTVCGSPYPLLLHSVGALDDYIKDGVIEGYEDETLPVLEEGICVYTKRFDDNEELAGFRNPHNSPNNCLYLINRKHKLIDWYFNFSNNIMAVNCIHTDVQDRANGMDFDADFTYVTNAGVINQCVKKAQSFPTIVNKIDKDTTPYNNTLQDKAKIDNTLAQSKIDIGVTSNMAQLALSWYFMGNNQSEDLENIVSICSVLAQVAIDNSKRKYAVDLQKEIDRISKLPCMKKFITDGKKKLVAKPYFWQFIKECSVPNPKSSFGEDFEEKVDKLLEAKNKKQKKIVDVKRHCLTERICPMDWIQDELDNKIENAWTNDPKDKDLDFVKNIQGKADCRQLQKFLLIVEDLDKWVKNKKLEGIDDEDKWIVQQTIKTQDTFAELNKITLDIKTMQILIKRALKQNKHIKLKLLNCLYSRNEKSKKLFIECFTENVEFDCEYMPAM